MRLAVVGPKGADDLRTTPALERQMISWLPWDGFNGRSRALGACYRLPQDSGVYEASGVIACTYHPLGKKLEASKAYPFMRRNGYQVLGPSLSSPSNFVLCSTPDACVDGGHTTRLTGGTGQALRIANAYSRPIFNLENGDHLERILQFLAKHRQEWVSHWELISGFAAAEATKPSCPEQVAMLSALGVSWEAPTTDMGPA